MLRRFIITWLIVSILGYGMALAADVHGELLADDGYSTLDTTPDQDQHGDSDCGHCSHGATHMLGLESSLTSLTVPLGSPLQCDYRAEMQAPPLQLPLRPPIPA